MSELHFPAPTRVPVPPSRNAREEIRKTFNPRFSSRPSLRETSFSPSSLRASPEKFSIARRDGRKSIIVRDATGSLLPGKIVLWYLRILFASNRPYVTRNRENPNSDENTNSPTNVFLQAAGYLSS